MTSHPLELKSKAKKIIAMKPKKNNSLALALKRRIVRRILLARKKARSMNNLKN